MQYRSWGALPDPGGLLDQEYGLLDRMTLALNVYQAFTSIRQAGNKLTEWAQANPELNDIYRWTMELRDADN